MNNMIYDFATHSLYYDDQGVDFPIFSLAINTLELVFELETGKLIKIQGFFPIVKALSCSIDFPRWEEKDYRINDFDLSNCKPSAVYDLMQKIPETKKYFQELLIKYDSERGVIQIGSEMKKRESGIKVNDHIMCGFDQNLTLKCLYIVPTIFIS